jgi:hypothetical protein
MRGGGGARGRGLGETRRAPLQIVNRMLAAHGLDVVERAAKKRYGPTRWTVAWPLDHLSRAPQTESEARRASRLTALSAARCLLPRIGVKASL